MIIAYEFICFNDININTVSIIRRKFKMYLFLYQHIFFDNSKKGECSMKTKKILISGLCLASILTAGLISVNAGVKDGITWQSAEYVNIPPNGGTKYNLTQGSKKVTTSATASMKASYGAWLTPYARFITSGKADRSPAVGVTQSVIHPKLYSTAGKGDTLYTKMSTSNLDPGYIEVSLKFASDHID